MLQTVFGPNAPSIRRRLAQLGAQYGIDFMWEGKTGNSRDAHKLILLAMEQDAAAAAGSQQNGSTHSSPSLEEIPNGTTNGAAITTNGAATATDGAAISTNEAAITTSNDTPNNHSNTLPNNHPPNPPTPPPTLLHRTTTALYTTTFTTPSDISSPTTLSTLACTLGLFPTATDALAYLSDTTNPTAGRRVDAASRAARAVGVTAVPSYVVQGRWQVGGMQGEGVWRGVLEGVRGAVLEGDRIGDGDGDGDGDGRFMVEEGEAGRGSA